jgi:hypothetical protein
MPIYSRIEGSKCVSLTLQAISAWLYAAANPLRDGNAWLELLMRDDDTNLRLTALRLLEVRKAYAGGGR